MPYKAAGYVKNAGKECVLNLEVNNGKARIVVYATQILEKARITLTADGKSIFEETADLSPVNIFRAEVQVSVPETALTVAVNASGGRRLLEYTPRPKKIEEIPDYKRQLDIDTGIEII